MLGVENYGSDNDSDNELSPNGSPPVEKLASIPKPPPKTKRAPKKITISLPSLGEDDVEAEQPPAKKPKLQSGAGFSSLLGMLPAPKQKLPVVPPPERVLGAGRRPGLVFDHSGTASAPPTLDSQENEDGLASGPSLDNLPSTLFRPTSIGRAGTATSSKVLPKASIPPFADFFSLDSASSSLSTLPVSRPPKPSTEEISSVASVFTVSSAPPVEEFTAPEPTPTDPYPGYYMLPSGTWAAYDPTYYRSFYDKWQNEYNAHVRALEKGVAKGFEELDRSGAQEVDAMKEMAKAKKEIQEREERKAVTSGAKGDLAAPRMNVKGAKLGNLARSRHQLTTLLHEAYENRDALEERIAEGRRNRKEAGNKYGF